MQADFIQKRVGDGLFGGLNGAIFARCFARAHHGLAHLVHHGANVGEVQVDQTGTDHQVRHTLHTLIKHVIRHGEGFGEGGLFIGQTEQVLVWNDDQGVNDLLQSGDALLGLTHALGPFELEGLGHHTHSQHTQLTRGLRDDRGRAGAGAAAHASRNEAHVRPGQMVDDFFDRFFGRSTPDRGARTRAQPFGHLDTDLQPMLGLVLLKRLRVGVGHNEIDTLELLVDHVIDRIAARAADAKHGDPRGQFLAPLRFNEIQCHDPLRLVF